MSRQVFINGASVAPHVAFSPDGSKVAVGGGGGGSIVRRASDGGVLYGISEPLAFSADSQALVTVDEQARQYWLIRASDGAIVRTFNPGSTETVIAAGFGSGIAVRVVVQPVRPGAGAGSTYHALVEDTTRAQTFTRTNVASAVLSPDASLLAIGDTDGNIVIRDAVTLAESSPVTGSRIVFASDSTRAAVVNSASVAILKVKEAGARLAVPAPLFSLATAALSVAFSPDGTRIGTGNADHTAMLWSGSDGSLAHTLWNINGHINPVYAVAFSPDGTTLATGGSDEIIKLWRTADGADLRTMNTLYIPDALVFLPDGRLVAASDAGADVWDVVSGTRLKPLSGGGSCVVSTDGSTLLMTDGAVGVIRYSLADYSSLAPLPISPAGPKFLAGFQIAPNGSIKTALDGAGVLRVWCSP
jgi:WD40 repeat protein